MNLLFFAAWVVLATSSSVSSFTAPLASWRLSRIAVLELLAEKTTENKPSLVQQQQKQQQQKLKEEKRKLTNEFQDYRLKQYKIIEEYERKIKEQQKQLNATSSSAVDGQRFLTNETQRLESELKNQTDQLERVSTEKRKLQNEYQDYRMKQYDVQQNYERTIEELKAAQQTMPPALVVEKDELERKNRVLRTENQQFAVQIRDFENEKEAFSQNITELQQHHQDEVQQMEMKMHALEEDLQKSQQSLLTAQKERDDLQKQYQQAQEDLSSVIAQWQDRYESEQAARSDELKESSQRLQNAQLQSRNDAEKLRRELTQKYQNEIIALRTKLYNMEETLSETRSALASAQNTNRQQELNLDQLTTERTSVRALTRRTRQILVERAKHFFRRKKSTMVTPLTMSESAEQQ